MMIMLNDIELYNDLKKLSDDDKAEYADEISTFSKNLKSIAKLRKKYGTELDALDMVDRM